MKLIVGLGNPGRQYEGTRHNIGFAVIRELVDRAGGVVPRAKFDGEWCEVSWEGEKCLLGRPLTFMNASGQCVQPARDFYKVTNDDILVICDDLALPVGKLRLRAQGSAGGQKGLADILKRLGSEAIARLRIGIGAAPPGWDAADYVLARFPAAEKDVVRDIVNKAADAAVDWATRGVAFAMNKYNAA
ncbi:MAG: aminoacyl-tRNA hydrolase [Pirellulales bacterium]